MTVARLSRQTRAALTSQKHASEMNEPFRFKTKADIQRYAALLRVYPCLKVEDMRIRRVALKDLNSALSIAHSRMTISLVSMPNARNTNTLLDTFSSVGPAAIKPSSNQQISRLKRLDVTISVLVEKVPALPRLTSLEFLKFGGSYIQLEPFLIAAPNLKSLEWSVDESKDIGRLLNALGNFTCARTIERLELYADISIRPPRKTCYTAWECSYFPALKELDIPDDFSIPLPLQRPGGVFGTLNIWDSKGIRLGKNRGFRMRRLEIGDSAHSTEELLDLIPSLNLKFEELGLIDGWAEHGVSGGMLLRRLPFIKQVFYEMRDIFFNKTDCVRGHLTRISKEGDAFQVRCEGWVPAYGLDGLEEDEVFISSASLLCKTTAGVVKALRFRPKRLMLENLLSVSSLSEVGDWNGVEEIWLRRSARIRVELHDRGVTLEELVPKFRGIKVYLD